MNPSLKTRIIINETLYKSTCFHPSQLHRGFCSKLDIWKPAPGSNSKTTWETVRLITTTFRLLRLYWVEWDCKMTTDEELGCGWGSRGLFQGTVMAFAWRYWGNNNNNNNNNKPSGESEPDWDQNQGPPEYKSRALPTKGLSPFMIVAPWHR